jgi:hypothetical protein
MKTFPVFCGYHLDGVPGTAVKKCAVGALANTFLATNAEIWINLDASKGRVILIRHPEHARFDGTVLDTRRRPGTSCTTIGGNSQNPRFLFSRGFAVTD